MEFGLVSSLMTLFQPLIINLFSPEIIATKFGSCCSKKHTPKSSDLIRPYSQD
jgi:hypothetical protein